MKLRLITEEFNKWQWLDDHYLEMRKATRSNNTLGHSTTIGDVRSSDDNHAYMIVTPVKSGKSIKWFETLIKPESEDKVTVYIYEDKITDRRKESDVMSGIDTEGVTSKVFSDFDWSEVFDYVENIMKSQVN